jgi:hypothetical protein
MSTVTVVSIEHPATATASRATSATSASRERLALGTYFS